jgi:hypothetical protein
MCTGTYFKCNAPLASAISSTIFVYSPDSLQFSEMKAITWISHIRTHTDSWVSLHVTDYSISTSQFILEQHSKVRELLTQFLDSINLCKMISITLYVVEKRAGISETLNEMKGKVNELNK